MEQKEASNENRKPPSSGGSAFRESSAVFEPRTVFDGREAREAYVVDDSYHEAGTAWSPVPVTNEAEEVYTEQV